MGKSSSRKKRSKYSSLDRGRKRNKSKRAKSKKFRHHDDSDSYSSDDSRSLTSVSLSDEDSYRGRKSRSSTRKDVKGTKRRARSHSSNSEESFRSRKRKGSRGKVDSGVRKKSLKHKKNNRRKKSQRESSINSRSCSTCQSSSDSSGESEYESYRGRSEKRGNNLKSLKNVKSRSKKRRYRSRSYASHSRDSGSDYCREEKVTDRNNSKRLRSVITFANDDKEERELDEQKEEVIYEDDGYPSSRSNDSYDGGNKINSSDQPPIASEKKSSKENEKKDSFDIKTTESSSRCVGGDDQFVEVKPASDGFRTNDSLGEKIDEITEASGKVHDDLETLLRQKALENLKRFRGGMQINTTNNANGKGESSAASKSPCPRKAELSENDPKDKCIQGVEGDSVHSPQEEKIPDGKNRGSASASVENNACLTSNVAVGKRDKVNTTFSRGINRQRLVTSALRQAVSTCTTNAVAAPNVKLVSQSGSVEVDGTSESGKTNIEKVNHASGSDSAKSSTCLPSAGRDAGLNSFQDEDKQSSQMEERATKLPESLSSAGNVDTVNNASGSDTAQPSSYDASAAQDINPSEGQADDKEGSQLERKTMSVMRGGEMVQVSYKVYIPKKASALARRQLKR